MSTIVLLKQSLALVIGHLASVSERLAEALELRNLANEERQRLLDEWMGWFDDCDGTIDTIERYLAQTYREFLRRESSFGSISSTSCAATRTECATPSCVSMGCHSEVEQPRALLAPSSQSDAITAGSSRGYAGVLTLHALR